MDNSYYRVNHKTYGQCILTLSKKSNNPEIVLKLNNVDKSWEDKEDFYDSSCVFHVSNMFCAKLPPGYTQSRFTINDIAHLGIKYGMKYGDALRLARRINI